MSFRFTKCTTNKPWRAHPDHSIPKRRTITAEHTEKATVRKKKKKKKKKKKHEAKSSITVRKEKEGRKRTCKVQIRRRRKREEPRSERRGRWGRGTWGSCRRRRSGRRRDCADRRRCRRWRRGRRRRRSSSFPLDFAAVEVGVSGLTSVSASNSASDRERKLGNERKREIRGFTLNFLFFPNLDNDTDCSISFLFKI